MGSASGPANVVLTRLHRHAVAVLLVISGLFCCNAAVGAKNWSLNPGIALSETYSDNVAPNAAGVDESDFITQVNPELQAELNGRRIQASLNYRMQNIFYKRTASEDTTFHQYLARAGAEILPEHLFIDASSTLSQRIINTTGVRSRNNYALTANRADQFTTSIRPSWYQPIGSYAEALLDYERGYVKFDGNLAGVNADSILDAASLTVNSLSGERRLSWKAHVHEQNILYDDDAYNDLQFRSASLLLGYRIIAGLSPLVLIGYDDNDIGYRPGSSDPAGKLWALGVRWQPNTRTELEALAGHRYFGNTYSVNWRQRGRYLTSGLTYKEEVSGEVATALEGVSLVDSAGGYSYSGLGVTNNVFLSKTARASARFQKSRTTITVSPFYIKRQYENAAQDESVSGINGTWEWAFAPKTTFTLSLQRDKTDSSGDENQIFTSLELLLERQLGKQTAASLEYSYDNQDSDNGLFAYTENAISAQLRYRFGTPPEKKAESPLLRSRKQLREREY